MKHTKERVIALDYFRGAFILLMLINHSILFSKPFVFFAGANALWTSAAEMFFLISGITLFVVRGDQMKAGFKPVARRIWRRAGMTYLLYALTSCLLLILMYLLPAGVAAATIGPQPSAHGLALLAQIMTFRYSIGLSNFLMFYAVFFAIAPLALYALQKRFWPAVLGLSLLIYAMAWAQFFPAGTLTSFASWQAYYVLGIAIGKYRAGIISWFYGLPAAAVRRVSNAIFVAASASIFLSVLLAYDLYPHVAGLVKDGWLPAKAQGAYFHLLAHKPTLTMLLTDGRLGILRPLAALVTLGGGYLLYQRHKQALLSRTGNFVNGFGRDTLAIFIAQAFAIPVISSLPIERNFINNLMLTSFLVFIMWAVTKRAALYKTTVQYSHLFQARLSAQKPFFSGETDEI